jgi:hypothetical protein
MVVMELDHENAGHHMTFDPRCFELAEMFLEDAPSINSTAHRRELAALIQQTVEDYISHEERRPAPKCAVPDACAIHPAATD